MILDKTLMFSELQALTTTAPSTNIVDLGSVRDIGQGEELWLTVRVGTAAASTGSSTVTIALQTDTASGFGTAVTLAQTAAIAKASLTANTEVWKIPLPEGVQRYLRLNYTVATADLTAGTFDAFLSLDRRQNSYYASGVPVGGF